MAKNEAKAKQHLRLNFYYLRIICFRHPHYHPKIIGDIQKNVQKSKYVYINEVISLMTIKMRLKIINRSHKYDINRPRPKHRLNILNI